MTYIIDPVKCIDCGTCAASCPSDAISAKKIHPGCIAYDESGKVVLHIGPSLVTFSPQSQDKYTPEHEEED